MKRPPGSRLNDEECCDANGQSDTAAHWD